MPFWWTFWDGIKSYDYVVCTSRAQDKFLGRGAIELWLTHTQGTHRWRWPHIDLSGGQGTGDPSHNRRSLFYFPNYRHCSHEIKRCWFLGRKVITNLDSMLKSRDITLPTKVCPIKAMVFQWPCVDVRVGRWRKLSTKELMTLNCGVGEDSWVSLGLQGDPTSLT